MRDAGGFTLVETMVALLLIGTGLMALATLSGTVTRANARSAALTAASALAQERIEQLRAGSYAAIANGTDVRRVDGTDYDRRWTVAADDPAPGLKTITAWVAWTTRGITHVTVLRTIRGSR